MVLFHHGRGSQEKLFGESKQHSALEVLPSHRLTGNQVFTLAAMMAHNLARELQMRLRPPTRRLSAKRPARWVFNNLNTLRRRLFLRAGLITRPQGELTLKVNADPAVQEELLSYMVALGPEPSARSSGRDGSPSLEPRLAA